MCVGFLTKCCWEKIWSARVPPSKYGMTRKPWFCVSNIRTRRRMLSWLWFDSAEWISISWRMADVTCLLAFRMTFTAHVSCWPHVA
jgi:hypothetical protein